MKALTREQLQKRKEKAVRFLRDVLEDPERADEIEDESLEDYAERRHIRIKNPKGAELMEVRTRRELLERIQQLEKEKEHLQKLKNPKGTNPMAVGTKRELLERIEELEEENENLQSQLDEIADIVAPEEEEQEEGE
jgi:hypothetical protein